ncbi:hypothetical protein ACPV5S_15700 [Vibrio astriarenae]
MTLTDVVPFEFARYVMDDVAGVLDAIPTSHGWREEVLNRKAYLAISDEVAMILIPTDESVHLWLGAALNPTQKVDLAQVFDGAEALAVALGKRFIAFGSSRRGWKRVAKHYGFLNIGTEYQRTVRHVQTEKK